MPPFLRVAAAALVALLAIAMVAVIGLWVAGAPIGRSPGTSDDPSPTAGTEGSTRPEPSSSSADQSVEPEEAFAQIEDQVLALRELPAPDIGPAEIISRQQLAEELEEILDESWTEEELARANLQLRALGLLTPDQDLRALTEQLYAGQVLGFYDFLEKRMVVVSDQGLTAEARITYAHEYTHALQDAAFDTFERREGMTDDDAILALQALEEGDATVVMFQWAFQHLSPDDLQDFGATPLPDMSGIPGWMVRQLELPYLAGFTFVNALATSGGWEAVNAAYDEPPASTEQVLHPDKYLAGEEPASVDAPAIAAVLGDVWTDLDPTTMGEAMVDIWLDHLDVAPQVATAAAAGWGGDRLTVAEGPDGEWSMAWTLSWDSAAEAEEFEAAYAQIAPPAGLATRLLRTAAEETVVLHASSVDLLEAMVEALEG